jgi:predicted GTPase
LLVANKMDLTGAEEQVAELCTAVGQRVIGISAVTGLNIAALTEALWETVAAERAASPAEPAPALPPVPSVNGNGVLSDDASASEQSD